jgi:hypothetical protein
VDIQSRAFQNPARGVKHEFADATVGLFTINAVGGVFPGIGAGETLNITVLKASPATAVVALPGPSPTVAAVIAALNAAILTLTGSPGAAVSRGDGIGIRPVDSGVVAVTGGTGMVGLFGDTQFRTTADIRVASVEALGGWSELDPEIDETTGLDVVQIVDGQNAGFYPGPFLLDPDASVTYPSTIQSRALVLADSLAELLVGTETDFLAPEDSRRVKVGARSLGSARCFFLEATTFEVSKDTVFSFETTDGVTARFVPDPTLTYQTIPPLPDGTVPDDGSSPDGGTTFTSASQEFILSNIKPGDELVIETFPVKGTVALPNPVPNLVGLTFVFSLEEGPDRTLTFIRDDVSLSADEVSRIGVANQINAMAGVDIAEIDASDNLKFVTELDLVIRKDGTALDTILGSISGFTPTTLFSSGDVSNASPHAGTYDIATVPTATTLTVDSATPFPVVSEYASPITNQTFRVRRTGVQRISTTEMEDNDTEASLFYFDVELVSEGSGDFWNIDADEQMTATGFKSDGYYLSTDDENLTFSDTEEVKLIVSRSILESGVDDDPENATQITGQNLLVRYDRSSAVTNVQNFAQSDFERAIAANPLVRHLVPHFVRFDVTYFGGSEESIVVPDLEKLIRELFPIDTLDASAVQKTILDRGATKITNPLTLLAIVHNVDRTITAQRSKDSLSTTRLAAFVPDILNVTRSVT